MFERAYYSLDAPVKRVAAADHPIPASPILEKATLPGAGDIVKAVAEVLEDLDAQSEDTHERPYDSLREKMRKTIQEMKEEGLVKPDAFIDKPIDPEVVVAKVKELIGN